MILIQYNFVRIQIWILWNLFRVNKSITKWNAQYTTTSQRGQSSRRDKTHETKSKKLMQLANKNVEECLTLDRLKCYIKKD